MRFGLKHTTDKKEKKKPKLFNGSETQKRIGLYLVLCVLGCVFFGLLRRRPTLRERRIAHKHIRAIRILVN